MTDREFLPRSFKATFIPSKSGHKIAVTVDGQPCGDVITDNAYEPDYYRYHDVFHLTFAARLGWSPCTRAMLKRKRKSNPRIDEVEDGARAQITEEAIALMLFNDAKEKGLYAEGQSVDSNVLDMVLTMCRGIEAASFSREAWKEAIQESYRLFRLLIDHNGGQIEFEGQGLARFDGTVQLC